MTINSLSRLIVGLVLIASASTANAQATRTWVSGVGDDANPCSRTAPCKTFAGAISKTAAGGQINALDPGAFGAVTITKAITIEAQPFAGVLSTLGANGIVVNAGAGDVVILRGLTVDGAGSGGHGIRFLAGHTLSVENCTIQRFANNGIDFVPSGTSRLQIKSTSIRHNGSSSASVGGVLVSPIGGFAQVQLDGVTLQGNNGFGMRLNANAAAHVKNSVATQNTNLGFSVHSASSPSALFLDHSASTFNGTGVLSTSSQAVVRLDKTSITGNTTGVSVTAGGTAISFGNNAISGNVTNVSGTLTGEALQ